MERYFPMSDINPIDIIEIIMLMKYATFTLKLFAQLVVIFVQKSSVL